MKWFCLVYDTENLLYTDFYSRQSSIIYLIINILSQMEYYQVESLSLL